MTAATESPSPQKLKKANLEGGWKVAIWFLLPSLIGWLAFIFIPVLRGVYLSFTDWNLLSNSGDFVGTDNYSTLFNELFSMTNPIPTKTALRLLGWSVGGCRMPLTDATPEVEARMKQLLIELQLM